MSVFNRRRFFAASTVSGVLLVTSIFAHTQAGNSSMRWTGYAPVNGLSLYYEIQGSGSGMPRRIGCRRNVQQNSTGALEEAASHRRPLLPFRCRFVN